MAHNPYNSDNARPQEQGACRHDAARGRTQQNLDGVRRALAQALRGRGVVFDDVKPQPGADSADTTDAAGDEAADLTPEEAAAAAAAREEARKRSALQQDMAQRILAETRTSLMMAMRYLDMAFWKMPLAADRFEFALATDGMRLYFSPANVIVRFRESSAELARDFLHTILHCVFRQPFETCREHPVLWSYACDMCVEMVAIEMAGKRFPSADDAERLDVAKRVRAATSALTPAQIYRLMVRLRTADAEELSREEDQLARLLRESEPLFVRDSHDYWDLRRPDEPDSSDDDGDEEGKDPTQENDDSGVGSTSESGEDPADEQGGDADSDNGEGGQGNQGGNGDDLDADRDSDENGAEDPASEDADQSDESSSGRDAAGGQGEQGDVPDSPHAQSAGDQGGDQPDGDNAADEGAAPDSDSDNAKPGAADRPAEGNRPNNQSQQDVRQGAAQQKQANPRADGGPQQPQAQQQNQPFEQASLDNLNPQQAQADWEAISKQIQADLQTMSQQRGDGAGDLMANLQLVNRSRVNYADFLRQFARMGEDMRLNDDEFDYVYYTYGLSRYGNMPLIEPLEYKESNRVREFVIALDTSGSCSGDLVRSFVTRTYEILKSSEEFGTQVNIHIIQCDATIQKDTVITSVDDFTRYLDSFEVLGFGGTDFRPVFAYVDDLVRTGEFEDLRGLVYFTDGAGIYPDSPPGYDVAFVFVDEAGQQRRVPPWAMRVVMDEDSIRQL